jgi:hypothetical protein
MAVDSSPDWMGFLIQSKIPPSVNQTSVCVTHLIASRHVYRATWEGEIKTIATAGMIDD